MRVYKEDYTGEKFGKLTVLKNITKNGKDAFLCRCDCGNEREVFKYNLLRGNTKSCGCFTREFVRQTIRDPERQKIKRRKTKHGESTTSLYRILNSIKQICYNPNNIQYKKYGALGIKVCNEWCSSYINFRNWAINAGYEKDLTLSRIDDTKDFSPENCKWITCYEGRRKQAKKIYKYNNKKYSMKELSQVFNIKRPLLYYRIYTRKWSVERALETPVNK